jgi:hypothetical protein
MNKELCMPLESTDHKRRLSELSRGLRDLHRALVKAAQTEYEIQSGPVNDPGHLLQLLTKHPEFDWLHQLSEFMVGVDELLDAELVSESDLKSVLTAATSLITPSSPDTSEFSKRYLAALHSDPSIVMAHAHVRSLLT